MFYRSPVVDVPEEMKVLLENIDLSGAPFEEFAKTVAEEALVQARGGILVDYPKVEGFYTKKQAEDEQIRPFLKYYYAEQIYNWEFSVINNVRTLTRVLVDESFDVTEFDDTGQTVIRELKLEWSNEYSQWVYRNTLFIEGRDEEIDRGDIRLRKTQRSERKARVHSTIIPLMADGKPLERIPFQFISDKYEQVKIRKAPLSDVADLNIEHYRKSVEISSALFHCAHPTPIFCGFNFEKGKPVLLGSRQGVVSANPEAHASYMELNGQSITEIRKERDSILVEAASMGARIGATATTRSQNETAEAARIKSSGETAILNTLTTALDHIFRKVFLIMAEWMMISEAEISVMFNREYMPFRLEGNDINALNAAVQNNLLSANEVLEIFKNGGIVKQNLTVKEYLDNLTETAKLRRELALLEGKDLDKKEFKTGGTPIKSGIIPKDSEQDSGKQKLIDKDADKIAEIS